MVNELDKVIELLSLVANKTINCDTAEDLAKDISWDKIPEIGNLYENLFHYWHDQDIRERDHEYKIMQESELHQLIQHLKNGKFVEACSISFLRAAPTSN